LPPGRRPIPGLNENRTRSDKFENVITHSSYGKDTAQGWDGDHSKPLSEGGTYHPNNLQPLQAGVNRYEKSDNHPFQPDSSSNYGKSVQTYREEHNYAPPSTDGRSSAVKTCDLRFNASGEVDRTSASVRSGETLVRKDGQVDGRSSSVKSGDVLLKQQ